MALPKNCFNTSMHRPKPASQEITFFVPYFAKVHLFISLLIYFHPMPLPLCISLNFFHQLCALLTVLVQKHLFAPTFKQNACVSSMLLK